MQALTPLVEPLSIDEAFLDLAGTRRVHGAPAGEVLARLRGEVERELGITVSIGLSYNKFLAKIASDLDKPRGFAVIGRAEATRPSWPTSRSAASGASARPWRRGSPDGIRPSASCCATRRSIC